MKFLGVFLVSLALLSGAYLAMVCAVDPRAELGDPVKPRLLPSVTMNARTEKMRLFHDYHGRGTVGGLILGSSRAMKLKPAEFDRRTGLRFFNFAVDRARIEDYLAIYRWTLAQGAQPKMLVVGLDIEALHNDDKLDDRLERNPALQAALGAEKKSGTDRIEALASEAALLKSTLTQSYWRDTRQSVKVWLHPPKPEAVVSRIEPDGYLRYPKWEWERANGRFDLARELETGCAGYVGYFTGMKELSTSRKALFEKLVAEAKSRGARVKIWITALHPELAGRLERQTQYASLRESAWRFLKELEARHGVEVFDFSDPERFGGTAAGWYDAAHVDESNVALLTARLMGGRD